MIGEEDVLMSRFQGPLYRHVSGAGWPAVGRQDHMLQLIVRQRMLERTRIVNRINLRKWQRLVANACKQALEESQVALRAEKVRNNQGTHGLLEPPAQSAALLCNRVVLPHLKLPRRLKHRKQSRSDVE